MRADPPDAMWGVATLTYRLWNRMFDKQLNWQAGLECPKHLYYAIKQQVEQR
jgi:hypothetical protein